MQQLHAHESTRDIPIILLSARADRGRGWKALQPARMRHTALLHEQALQVEKTELLKISVLRHRAGITQRGKPGFAGGVTKV